MNTTEAMEVTSTIQRSRGRRSTAVPSKKKSFYMYIAQQIQYCGYRPEHVYTLQTGVLHWKLLHSSERSDNDERLTVMMCSNGTGTHRMPLWTVGMRRNPQDRLCPVSFDVCRNVVTVSAYTLLRWFKEEFINLVKNRSPETKILLFAENAPFSSSIEMKFNLLNPNFRVVFASSAASKHIQPIYGGIMKDLKNLYQSKLLRSLLVQSGGVDCKVMQQMNEFKLDDAIHIIMDCWTSIKECDLKKAWESLFSGTDDSRMSAIVDHDEQEQHIQYDKEDINVFIGGVRRGRLSFKDQCTLMIRLTWGLSTNNDDLEARARILCTEDLIDWDFDETIVISSDEDEEESRLVIDEEESRLVIDEDRESDLGEVSSTMVVDRESDDCEGLSVADEDFNSIDCYKPEPREDAVAAATKATVAAYNASTASTYAPSTSPTTICAASTSVAPAYNDIPFNDTATTALNHQHSLIHKPTPTHSEVMVALDKIIVWFKAQPEYVMNEEKLLRRLKDMASRKNKTSSYGG